jgi:uncharacterized alpha-E superfamily protein
MRYLSIRNADSLYWIGRYLQRFGIVAKESVIAFDDIIDTDFEAGVRLFKKMDYDIEYTNASDFFKHISIGIDDASLLYYIKMARENAIVIRDIMEDDAFASINIIFNKLSAEQNPTPKFVEQLLRELYGFWGVIFLKTVKSKLTLFLEFGQIVEAMDMKLTLFEDISMVLFDIEKLNHIGKELSGTYKPIVVRHSNIEKLRQTINSKIENVIKYEY